MDSLMGPPPKEFLRRSEKSRQYWDEEGTFYYHPTLPTQAPFPCFCTCDQPLELIGNWIAATPIPDQSLESRETRLQGRDKELLLAFVRRILRWLPEERPVASELWDDEFLEQHNLEEEEGPQES
jgi:hypothetical protein